MREPMSLDAAAHRAALNVSLFEVILDMPVKEDIPAVLYDLISIACDTNSAIRRALDKGVGNDA
jgi:hypothetical protein